MGEDSMKLKERIALLAGAAGACDEGLQELAETKSKAEMIRCFFENQKEVAFVGKCYAVVEITERMMCRIWAADCTKLNIRASNGARLIIDALDNADIIVDECSGAHVTVYLYGNATCTGADLIVRKGATYEL